jgi:hypothetical protein
MALLFVDSFDHYQIADLPAKWTTVPGSGLSLPAASGRCGTAALKHAGNSNVVKGLTFATLTGTIGVACNIPAGYGGSGAVNLLAVGTATTVIHLLLYRQNDGSLAVQRNDPSAVVLGVTAPDVMRTGEWYFIEWQMKIDNGTAGFVTVRVDNTVVLNVTGIKTQSSSTGTALELRTALLMGTLSNVTHYYDDLYILDSAGAAPWNTFLGDVRIEYLQPNAPGLNQAWSLVGSPSHWQAVNDIATPDGDTTHVESNTVGAIDTNRYQPTGLPSGTLFGAQLSLYVRKSEMGPRAIAPVVRSGSTQVTGASYTPPSGSYIYLHTPYAVNPITGNPWTIAEINAAEFGVTIAS